MVVKVVEARAVVLEVANLRQSFTALGGEEGSAIQGGDGEASGWREGVAMDGWKNVLADVWTTGYIICGWKFPPCSTGHCPLWGCVAKVELTKGPNEKKKI